MPSKFDAKTDQQICFSAKMGMLGADREVDVAERDLKVNKQKGAKELFTASVYVGKQKQSLFARLIRNHCHAEETPQQRPDH
jgi:hypothetical protein